MPDPILGYVPRPGRTTIVLSGSYSFSMTHLDDGLRITHPLQTDFSKSKGEIWIFGCSFTHGWSLNDDETYPWLVQRDFRDFEVLNFAVEAYSTVQSLLQLRRALEMKKPVLVILAYGSFHDERNSLTRSWMKRRTPSNANFSSNNLRLPYVKWASNHRPEILYQPLGYHGVPFLRYSALANLVDDSYNQALDRTYHSREASKVLIEEFARICRLNGITFVVAGILSDRETAEMLAYLGSEGIATLDISVDLSIRENTNLPYDEHPSAIANQQYARKLDSFLCGKLPGARSCQPNLQP